MADLLHNDEVDRVFDEAFTAEDGPRHHYRGVTEWFDKLDGDALHQLEHQREESFRRQSVTFIRRMDPARRPATLVQPSAPRAVAARKIQEQQQQQQQ